MTRFEECLRRGMMDANIAQYEYAIQKAESRELDASPRYCRERMRLLADPWTWAKRRPSIRRLNWRLIAIVAALLLLSACAYAVATGQFSQWFFRLGVNPEAPETSEKVLSRTGTVIQQSQTVGDATVTLNAALWDGTDVWLSIAIESPDIPEEVQRYTPLYTADCRLILRDDQWMEYERGRLMEQELNMEQIEEDLRSRLASGDRMDRLWLSGPETREGNTMTFQINEMLMSSWFTETKRPELTLHLENIATYVDGGVDENGVAQYPEPGVVFVEGPFDLTFTLEEPILPVRYGGAGIEVTVMDIPLRFTGFQLSATSLTAFYEAPDPVELLQSGETLTPEEKRQIQAAIMDILQASYASVRGLWTKDGKYVDFTNADSSGGSGGGSSGGGSGSVELYYPYPIDPATVTAVDLAGTRAELSGLKAVLPE